jgi:adenine-specific DNA-methyltransferase
MPVLDWIGKKAVVNHHRAVPYRIINCDPRESAGINDAGNLLVQGDNLEALKALLPYYSGSVKAAYIDPPYNTGNKEAEKNAWFYNDNVDSPELRAWLGKVVGAEGEDFSRHDKWLCMMYPRLRLLKDFLSEDGVVFVSIDDNEHRHLHSLLDEIFGAGNHVGTIVWYNATDNNPTNIAVEHEYIVCFAKRKSALEKVWKASESPVRDAIQVKARELIAAYGDNLPELQKQYATWFRDHKPQLWPFQEYDQIDATNVFTGSRSVHNPGREGYRYDIIHPVTMKPCKAPLMGYRFPPETRDQYLAEKRFIYGKDENKIVEIKIYINEWKAKLPSIIELDGRRGANELARIFPGKKVFNNPKPTDLIVELLSFATGPNDVVLDSFAGSATTGHAVLKLNKDDGGSRRFILVEMNDETARSVAAPRLKKVIEGYSWQGRDGGEGDSAAPLGSGFRYCTLGKPLLDSDGGIAPHTRFADLAAHVFFCETGSPIPKRASGSSSLLGVHQGRAVFLLFAEETPGVATSETVLTAGLLKRLATPANFGGTRVVYAEGCTVPKDRLARAGVVFKQIPYQIEGI